MSKKRIYIPKKLRSKVLSRFGARCGYCGEMSENLQLDHVEPFCSNYNEEKEANYMPSCQTCNRFKSGMRLEEFRSELSFQATRMLNYSINARMALRYRQIELKEKPIIFLFEKAALDHD